MIVKMIAVLRLVVLVAIAAQTQAALLDEVLLDFIPDAKILANKTGSAALLGSPISMWGDPYRLQNILAQLSDERPGPEKMNFYYIGGSITEGWGGIKKGMLDTKQTYIGWVEAWFEEQYPGRTVHHRRGKGATTSFWASSCIDSVIEQDADVVFVEYTINDLHSIRGEVEATLDNPKRRGTERLLRRLLTYEKRPAVVVLHTWAPKVLDTWTQRKPHNDFYTTYEDYWDIILKYYGIPSLSMRNALHTLVRSSEPGFGLNELWGDDLHPTVSGHAVLGYLILDYMKLVSTLTHQLGDRLANYVPKSRLPAPMFPDNHHHKGLCGHGNALKDQLWHKDHGWDWDIEIRDGHDSKEGWMADGVSNRGLFLVVPAESLPHLHIDNYTVHLGMVKSWKPFGTVAVRCRDNGCVCDEFEVDLHDETAETTMQVMTDFTIAQGTVVTPCIVMIEVLEKTSSTGRYVKVMSLGVEEQSSRGAEEAM